MNSEIDRLTAEVTAAKSRLREAIRRAPHQPVEDWELRNPDGSAVRLSALFGTKPDLLVIHNMGKGCRFCTLWADGLRGYVDHIQSRAALVLSSADSPEVLKEFAASRQWMFRCVSAHGSGFSRAMGMASEEGSPYPGVSAFAKLPDGSIVRTGMAGFGPGDDFCAVWPMFDLLRDGAAGWSPQYAYGPQVMSIGIDRDGACD